jgi:hypothetical protein
VGIARRDLLGAERWTRDPVRAVLVCRIPIHAPRLHGKRLATTGAEGIDGNVISPEPPPVAESASLGAGWLSSVGMRFIAVLRVFESRILQIMPWYLQVEDSGIFRSKWGSRVAEPGE